LPSSIKYLGGFKSNTSLTSIDFTDAINVEKIDDNCFENCSNLELDLGDIPQTVTSIG